MYPDPARGERASSGIPGWTIGASRA